LYFLIFVILTFWYPVESVPIYQPILVAPLPAINPPDLLTVVNLLIPHNRPWVDSGPVRQEIDGIYNHSAHVHWDGDHLTDGDVRRPLDFFLLAFPTAQWNKIISNTNRKLSALRLTAGVTLVEMKKYLGIRLMMSLEHSHGSVEDYWSTEVHEGFTRPHNYLDRTGMVLTRFKNISRGLCFHDMTIASVCVCLLTSFSDITNG
jgi:hypothetical protein